jgi:hypothetical protein
MRQIVAIDLPCNHLLGEHRAGLETGHAVPVSLFVMFMTTTWYGGGDRVPDWHAR